MMEKAESYEFVICAVPAVPYEKCANWVPEKDEELSVLVRILSTMFASSFIFQMNLRLRSKWAGYFHRSFKFIGNIGYLRYGLWDSSDITEEMWVSETRPERDEKAKIADIWMPLGEFASEPKFVDRVGLEMFRMKPMEYKRLFSKEDFPTLNVLAENVRDRKPGEWEIPVWELSDADEYFDANNIFEFDEETKLWSVVEPEN